MNSKKQILFLDDDQAYLETIRELFALWSRQGWDIHLATHTGKALAILQDHPIDLIVVDIHMPVVDGIQFLKLLQRRHPNLTKVVLTGTTEDQYRTESLANGAELFLQKPASIDGMESVYFTLNEMVEAAPQNGFRGVMRRVGLQEVIQLECLGKKSSVLEIGAPGLRGRIHLRDGNIIHAEVGDSTGVAALNRLLALETGDFSVKPFVDPGTESIDGQWEFLLMEAARIRDEEPEAAAAAPAPTPPPPADTLVETAPSPSPPRPNRVVPKKRVEPGTESLEPAIEEILVCEPDGGVLYEWKSEQSDTRIAMMRTIAERSREIRESKPLGDLDRLEILSPSGRMVIRWTPEWSMLVRSQNSRVRHPFETETQAAP